MDEAKIKDLLLRGMLLAEVARTKYLEIGNMQADSVGTVNRWMQEARDVVLGLDEKAPT